MLIYYQYDHDLVEGTNFKYNYGKMYGYYTKEKN